MQICIEEERKKSGVKKDGSEGKMLKMKINQIRERS